MCTNSAPNNVTSIFLHAVQRDMSAIFIYINEIWCFCETFLCSYLALKSDRRIIWCGSGPSDRALVWITLENLKLAPLRGSKCADFPRHWNRIRLNQNSIGEHSEVQTGGQKEGTLMSLICHVCRITLNHIKIQNNPFKSNQRKNWLYPSRDCEISFYFKGWMRFDLNLWHHRPFLLF